MNHFSFANVVACLALFVALGGTGYAALALPRDSVGARELRAHAVGHAELARNAVRSDNVRDGALELGDLSRDARAALAGSRGPAGAPGSVGPKGADGAPGASGAAGRDAVALWSIVSSFGTSFGGNATATERVATGVYTVRFAPSVAGCAYSASLALVQGFDPSPGSITVAGDGNGVRVKTFATDDSPESKGFHLIVVC
ncbi:MAG TPA: hypothetical protein VGM91_07690 [Conexibacter sp.]